MAHDGLRVLLIDDDADGLEALGMLLETWGYLVERAASGADGLATFRRRAPQIVVLDLRLGDIEGCEVIRRIATAATDVRIVVYSGFHGLAATARAAGASAFVLKPDLPALRRSLSGESGEQRGRQRGTKSGRDE